jgi:hypothetical protein
MPSPLPYLLPRPSSSRSFWDVRAFEPPGGSSLVPASLWIQWGFLRVWPVQRHFVLFIRIAIGCCFGSFYKSSFDVVSGLLILVMRRKQWLIKTWSLFVICWVTLHVSQAYRRTYVTLGLKILSLVLLEMFRFLHTDNWIKAPFAFLIRLLASTTAPTSLVTVLRRYVNEAACSTECQP